MRAIWKGSVSFGLVNVPVRLYAATENHDLGFYQVHDKDGGRIKYKRFCAIDGEEVAYQDIVKGYETGDGQQVILTDEDLAALPSRSSKEIAIEKFVPEDQIDPIQLDKCYYLEPDKTALKPYVLLRDALTDASRMALVTVSVRTRMTMAVLRVKDDVILLQTLLWPDEIRAAEFDNLGGEMHATAKELAMAESLVESLAGDYDPAEFDDDYAAAIQTLVERKIAGGEVMAEAAPAPDGGEVVDLLEALRRSVDKAKAARAAGAAGVMEASGGSVEDPADESSASRVPDASDTSDASDGVGGAGGSGRKPPAKKQVKGAKSRAS